MSTDAREIRLDDHGYATHDPHPRCQVATPHAWEDCGLYRTPAAVARPVAVHVLAALRPLVVRAVVAGSLRRGAESVGDIEIVAEPADVPEGLFGDVRLAIPEIRQTCEMIGRVTKGGERMIQVADVLSSGITLDLFLVHPPAEWGPVLTIRTGPAGFSKVLVTRLRWYGLRCKDGRVLDHHGEVVPCPTEEEFFAAARVPYLEPAERSVEALP